jgi:hypothetical protein
LERGREPQQLLARQHDLEPEPPKETRSPRAERLDLHPCVFHHATERRV